MKRGRKRKEGGRKRDRSALLELQQLREDAALPRREEREKLWARRADGSMGQAEVLERGLHGIYVHWVGLNRRMDEWIEEERVVHDYVPLEEVQEHSVSPLYSSQLLDMEQQPLAGGSADADSEHDEAEILEHESLTKVKNLDFVVLGRHKIGTWYFSPFPEEVVGDSRVLYIDEFTLRFFPTEDMLRRFQQKCPMRHPPGDEIYRDGNISVFEVDGRKERLYCQNLSLLAKLFLDHKNFRDEISPFLFYVMCEVDSAGCHIVGYFSKEKCSDQNFNLACILVLPSHQRKGYGRFLIELSYLLSKKQNIKGTPERPLSDLGKVSYHSFWLDKILQVLEREKSDTCISLVDISVATGIQVDDVQAVLRDRNVLVYSHTHGKYVLCCPPQLMEKHQQMRQRVKLRARKRNLHWAPLEETTPTRGTGGGNKH